jgi:hypothetical protein
MINQQIRTLVRQMALITIASEKQPPRRFPRLATLCCGERARKGQRPVTLGRPHQDCGLRFDERVDQSAATLIPETDFGNTFAHIAGTKWRGDVITGQKGACQRHVRSRSASRRCSAGSILRWPG